MVVKTPIVSSDVDGIKEMLNKNNSILFSLNNSSKMIDAISLIYNKDIDVNFLTNNAYKDYWEKIFKTKKYKRMNKILENLSDNNEI